MATDVVAPAIPFGVASQISTRPSFQVQPTELGAGTTSITPIQIPAVGYLNSILLDVAIKIDGTPGTLLKDAPFSVIDRINLRNAAGVNLLTPVTGFQLYAINKYGGMTTFGDSADPVAGPGYVVDNTEDGEIHFMLSIPLGIDIEDGYGAFPALASNANYQIEISLSPMTKVWQTAPDGATVAINGTAVYFDLPAATDSQGVAQETQPPSNAVSIWQVETPVVSSGNQLVQSFNTGNIIRTHILILRDASGNRLDSALPEKFELRLDNDTRFSLTKREFAFLMSRWFGFLAGSKKANAGDKWNSASQYQAALDEGILVLPYNALMGAQAGDPNNSRAQLLATLSTSLLQFNFQDFGANAASLEILTQSISTTDAEYLYNK